MIARLIRSNLRNPRLIFEDRDLEIMVLDNGRERLLSVNGAWNSRILTLAEEFRIQALLLSSSSSVPSLAPFKQLKQLRHLLIGCDDIADISVIGEMSHLRALRLTARKNTETISFANLINLRRCSIHLNRHREDILSLKSLRRLEIDSPHIRNLDLSKLANLHWLSCEISPKLTEITLCPTGKIFGLWIEQCPRLTTFHGSLESLIWLSTKGRNKLSLADHAMSSLEYVFALSAGEITWLPSLMRAKRLTWLHLTGSTRAPDEQIQRVRELRSLRVFTFDKKSKMSKYDRELPLKLA